MLRGLVVMDFSLLGELFKVFTSLRSYDRKFSPEKCANQLRFLNQVSVRVTLAPQIFV